MVQNQARSQELILTEAKPDSRHGGVLLATGSWSAMSSPVGLGQSPSRQRIFGMLEYRFVCSPEAQIA